MARRSPTARASRHDWQTQGESIRVVYVLDDWQGPTDAVIQCRHCGNHALLSAQDWCGANLATRIYTVSPLESPVVEIFLRNMKSDYCDLSRRGQEVQALETTAGPPAVVLAATLPGLTVIDAREFGRLPPVRRGTWRDGMPDSDDDTWFRYLGLSKS